MGSFSLSPCPKPECVFLLMSNVGAGRPPEGKSHNTEAGTPYDWFSLELLNLRFVHTGLQQCCQ